MSEVQPGKIGKIGYLILFTGQYLWIWPIINLIWRSLNLWDALFFVIGILLIVVGYRMTRKDMHMKRLGWKLLLWNFPNIRDRFALGLIAGGNFLAMMMISIFRTLDNTYLFWQNFGVLTSVAVVILLIGWALILTERESASPTQEHDGNTSTT